MINERSPFEIEHALRSYRLTLRFPDYYLITGHRILSHEPVRSEIKLPVTDFSLIVCNDSGFQSKNLANYEPVTDNLIQL